MSLSPLAIALKGIGFAPLNTALEGFADVAEFIGIGGPALGYRATPPLAPGRRRRQEDELMLIVAAALTILDEDD